MDGLFTEQRSLAGDGYFLGMGDVGGGSATLVTGANSAQANTCTPGAIRQTHLVGGATSAQANTASTGSATQDTTTFVSGSSSLQANACSAGAVRQTHLVGVASSVVHNACTAGAVSIPGSGTGATAAEIWAYEIAPGLSARQALLDLWTGQHTPAEVADAVVAKMLGARSLGAHIQAIAATSVGETTGAGTNHLTYTDGPVTVEADVPLPGVAGNRTNVVIAGV